MDIKKERIRHLLQILKLNQILNVTRGGIYFGATTNNDGYNNILFVLNYGLMANSDIVSFYVESYLGYLITEDRNNNMKLRHELYYGILW